MLTYKQWLREHGACKEGLRATRRTDRFSSALYAYPVYWLGWLSWELHDAELDKIRRQLELYEKAFRVRLAQMRLPWKDGLRATWKKTTKKSAPVVKRRPVRKS